jgi:hypothetical protein
LTLPVATSKAANRVVTLEAAFRTMCRAACSRGCIRSEPVRSELEIALSTFERLDRWLLAVLEARVFDTTQMTIAFLGGAI